MQIAVIDLGIGNLHSVEQALRAVAPDVSTVVTHDAQTVASADKLVLPGQGAIGTWFQSLRDRKLETAVRQALDEKPLLGICVGMQAMFDYCEEDGGLEGLGLFQGSVRHFSHFHGNKNNASTVKAARPQLGQLKIPQMGWNQVSQSQRHPLWHAIADQSYFYFVHSYCANLTPSANANVIYGVADYEHEFVAAVGRDNVFAVQFHPEKSHNDGLRLLKNFTQWSGKI